MPIGKDTCKTGIKDKPKEANVDAKKSQYLKKVSNARFITTHKINAFFALSL